MSVLLTSCYETSFDEAEFKLNQGSCLRPSLSNVLSKTAVFLQKVQVIWSDASSERKYKYATNNSGATTASAGFLTHAFTTRQSPCRLVIPRNPREFHFFTTVTKIRFYPYSLATSPSFKERTHFCLSVQSSSHNIDVFCYAEPLW